MEVRSIRTEGLGDTTYILGHDGIGLIVDPQRDIDRFTTQVDDLGIVARWVLETHLHNDYVSGAKDIATALGAELVIPAGAAPVYRHLPAFHNEDISDNGLTVRPIHTPGHTPEHMAYLVLVDGVETAVFSGGSLLVGSAGRSDLLGMDRAETLARLQFQSVNRLASLHDSTDLYPTHGAGSFCTATVAGSTHSTIGTEVRTNPVLAHRDADSFAAAHLSGLVPFPDYYQHMGPANLAGRPRPDLQLPPVLDEKRYTALGDDTVVVDARPKTEFASGHLPGALGVELRDDLGVWVGWVVPFDTSLVLVMNPDQSVEEAQRQLIRIGFDHIEGVIDDLSGWETKLVSHQIVDVDQFVELMREGAQFLDVRAPSEWATGTIDGSVRVYAPDLADAIPESLDQAKPVLVACETGYRASIAASILQQNGYQPVVLVGAGVPEVLEAI